jgi:succinate-semialdehyde dehydrogenase/glutarate-semialdehyde dehydrogenase
LRKLLGVFFYQEIFKMAIESKNPLNNEVVKTFSEEPDELILEKLENAHTTYKNWKQTSFSERSTLMKKAAEVLRNNKEKYAGLMTLEMGKAKREAISEVEKCARCCDYYADNAEEFLSNQKLEVPDGKAYIAYDPIGPVLAVMPWNFPLWQVFRFAAPNLMAGNVGSKVAERAGKNLKKTVLELGGSDPFIVLEDADIEEAAKTGAKARMINNGQSCIAAKRFILHKNIADDFLEKFKAEFEKLKIGDPDDDDNDYGPMAREDLADELLEQVNKSVDKGAKILIGGKRMDREGAFFEPTILTDVKPGMPAYEEELFGPVAIVIIAESNADAVRIVNDSRFGLGGSLWSQNIEEAQKLVRQVESGAVYINKLMASHPAVPFGGIKMSGYGRELSHLGIREFMNEKTIWIA